MSEKKITPVLLLTGYLGSGKTTLLNRILTNERNIRFAVIVNDLGEVNIDAELIQKGGVVGGGNQDDLVALQNGCICCTLRTDLIEQLSELAADDKFDYIVIEASGICEPEPIAQTICLMPRLDPKYTEHGTPRLDCICTVVDALRLKAEFGCGDALTQEIPADEERIESLIIDQIEFCNIILLNKIDEVTKEEAGRIRAVIRALQPKAKIIDTNYCDVPLEDLLNTRAFDFEKVATSATWVRELEDIHDEADDHDEHHHDGHHEHHHDHDEHDEHEHHHEHEHGHHHHHHHHDDEGEAEEYGVQTFVYTRREGFDLNKFDYFVTRCWPKNIIRAKGVLYFNHNRDMSNIFEQAGPQKKLTDAGYWYATAPAEELKAMAAADPSIMRNWDPVYGDRIVKLVFIGTNLDRAALTEALDDI